MHAVVKQFVLIALAVHLTLNLNPTAHAQATLTTPTLTGTVAVKSWKSLRDANIVKQDLDYSCGAASMATILQSFYGLSITEQDVLWAMDRLDAASFADLANVAGKFGFKAAGLALSFAELQKIKVPVIVYLQYRGEDHFSVLRGIDEQHVELGDPSWGNRRFSQRQFLAMWETREDAQFKGKILLLVPDKNKVQPVGHAFFAAPQENALPVELLAIRLF